MTDPEDKSVYGEIFEKELASLPKRPDIEENIRMVSLIARRAAARIHDGDGMSFRVELASQAEKAERALSAMMTAEANNDMEKFRASGPKLSNAFSAISTLSSEGIDDIAEERAFLKVALELLKRVEAYEDLSTKRASMLNEAAVRNLISRFSGVLLAYLPKARAAKAFAELKGDYKVIE